MEGAVFCGVRIERALGVRQAFLPAFQSVCSARCSAREVDFRAEPDLGRDQYHVAYATFNWSVPNLPHQRPFPTDTAKYPRRWKAAVFLWGSDRARARRETGIPACFSERLPRQMFGARGQF